GDTFNDGNSDEKPTHQVTLGDFYIGKYEVTQGQWKAVMGSNPSGFTACGDNCPVEQVNWNDVQTFITKLNQSSGMNYRLPTEAEWEYAARSGGKSEKYSGSSDVNAVAWYSGNAGSPGTTHQVGLKQANGLGLYDMSGNAWEWVNDWYGAFSSVAQTNPTGPTTGSGRVIRGGGWGDNATRVRASLRYNYTPSNRISDLSFRLAAPSTTPPAPSLNFYIYHQSDGTLNGLTTDGSSLTGNAQAYKETDGTWSIVGQGDFDGDGIKDLVWWNNRTGQVRIMLMSSATTVKSSTAVIYTEPNTYWRIVATGDIDGDGKADLIWWNKLTGQVAVTLVNGTTAVTTSNSIIYTEPNTTWKIVAAADFNGDKKVELLWCNSKTGQVALGQTNGTSASTANLIYTASDTDWRIAGVGDLDGDGKADIVWHNRTTGQVYGLLTNGSSVTNGAMMYTETNTYWEIVSVGNYTSDSKADLLWWNQLTGQLYLMPMNGLSVGSGGAMLNTQLDNSWKIQAETEWRDNLYGSGVTTTTK
ncbi:MAG: SUMF1/EgtB/PvdO family nonheme iron enzyme, partial [Desulfuromonadales bacterium]